MPDDGAPQESEERYHYVVEQASDIILLYDLDTRSLLEGNLAFHRFLGYSIEDIAGLSIYDIVAHEKESIDSNIEKAKKKKYCFVGQRKYRKKDGALLDVEVSINLFFVEGKGILCSIARDISERKLAEEALCRSEQEKAAILNGLKTVSVEYLDTQMRILWLNSAVQKHLNLPEDEIKGKRCFEIIQGLESPCPGCTALKALQTDEPQEGELITPDGKVWISHSNVIKDANGDVSGVVHVAVNITERKRAEKALAESENIYRAIFENTGTATMIIEENTIISLANSELEKLTGYSKKEIEEKIGWTDFVVKEDLERMLEQHKLRRIDPGAALNNYEFRAVNKNGHVKDILLQVDLIPGTKKSIASLLDITDRKQMEDVLRASNQLLDGIINTIPVRVFWKDKNLVFLGCNKIFAQDAGFTDPKDIIGKDDYQMSWRDQAESYRADDRQVIESGLPKLFIEEPQTTPEGNTIILLTSKTPLRSSEGKIIGVLGTYMDITENKRAEEELRESEEKYRMLVENLDEGIQVVNEDGTIIFANQRMEEIVGYGRGELVGKNALEMMDDRSREKAEAGMKQDRTEGSKIQIELLNFHKNGTPINVSMRGTSIKSLSKETLFLAVISDITERKRAETALRESEARYRTLFESGKDSIFLFPVKADGMPLNFTDVNAVACQVYGYTHDEFLTMSPSDLIAPGYHEMMSALGGELTKNKNMRAEWYDICKDGRRIPVDVSVTLFELGGEPICMAVVRDITEHKRAEEALLESEQRLANIIDFLPDATLVIDSEKKIIAWNRAMEALTGIKADDMLGKGNYEYALPFYGERRPMLVDLVFEPQSEIEKKYLDLKRFNGAIVGDIFTPRLKGDGAYLWGVASPIFDIHGKIVGAIESIKDITDIKQAEDRIKASLKEKEVLLKEIHHRVKNNLQVISALLSLQSSYIADEDIIKIFRDSQNRIKSMALVHENLYRSKDLGKVDFNEYVNQLVTHLSQSYGDLAGKIKFKVNSENVYLNINTAIPCGMIINELVANSFKHAFPDGRRGEVCVDLSSEGDGFRLIVSDNGVGIKGDTNIKESKTLGFRLIDTLVNQINGTISLDTINGFRCEIHFRGLK